MKKLCALTLVAALTVSFGTAQASDARTIGMGGAFVGVADDVNAVTHNAAGLGFFEEQELGFLHALDNDYDYNLIQYATALDKGGLGIAYGDYEHGHDLTIGYGFKIQPNTAIGINFTNTSPDYGDHDSTIGLSLLHKSGQLSYGLHYEDSVLTPGIAYRANAKTLVALDLYDCDTVNLGVEYALDKKLIARVGSNDGELTYGLGYKVNNTTNIDFAHDHTGSGTNYISLKTKF